MHLSGLKKHLRCEGIDLDDNLIAISKTRNPELVHHIGDMRQFDLAKRFDVVTCLFGSIGYLPDIDALNSGIQSMTQHLAKGGLLIVEPWLTPDVFKAGHLGSLFIDNDDLKIARINISRVEGRQSILDFHYLVGTPTGVDGLYEEHRMTLFTNEEYLAAFQNAGLSVERDADGLMGRGLFVGQA